MFHIGHLFPNFIGETIARLYEASGAEVKRANYQGDVGMHVAKSIWGMIKKLEEENLTIELLKNKDLTERQQFLGGAYAKGATAFKESDEIKEEIKQINALIYIVAQEYHAEKSNWKPRIDYKAKYNGSYDNYEQIKELYISGRQWSLEYFETIYKRLGTKFDYYFLRVRLVNMGMNL